MRQVWWIVCWKPYSQAPHSETAGRECHDQEVSLISHIYAHAVNPVTVLSGKTVDTNSYSSQILKKKKNLNEFLLCLKVDWFKSILWFPCLGFVYSHSHLQNKLAFYLYTCSLAAQCQRFIRPTILLQLFDVWIFICVCVCVLSGSLKSKSRNWKFERTNTCSESKMGFAHVLNGLSIKHCGQLTAEPSNTVFLVNELYSTAVLQERRWMPPRHHLHPSLSS